VADELPLILIDARPRILVFVIGVAVLASLSPGAEAQMGPAAPMVFADTHRTGMTGGLSAPAQVSPRPRSSEPGAPDRRCTEDGTHCISIANYIPDICRTIEKAARENALDPNFFARLLWRESLFDAGAVSPAGAEGIAQFMPETAKLRGLDDSFNPAEALHASANYLSELSRDYGNLGLAAAAYNGGEARVELFIAGEGGLPLETRAYVHAITGHSVETWREAPPESLDLSLDAERTFQAACRAQAANRSWREFRSTPPMLPWGVIVASHRDRDGAERQIERLQNRHAAILRGELVSYTHSRMPGMYRPLYNAQIGRNTRTDADALCGRLRAAGRSCMVLRN
jgi:hypothetical protein